MLAGYAIPVICETGERTDLVVSRQWQVEGLRRGNWKRGLACQHVAANGNDIARRPRRTHLFIGAKAMETTVADSSPRCSSGLIPIKMVLSRVKRCQKSFGNDSTSRTKIETNPWQVPNSIQPFNLQTTWSVEAQRFKQSAAVVSVM